MIRTIEEGLRALALRAVRKAASTGRNKRRLMRDAATLRVALLACIGAGSLAMVDASSSVVVSLCCAALGARTLAERRLQGRLAEDLETRDGYAREMERTGRAALLRGASMPGAFLSEAAVVSIVAVLAAGSAWLHGADAASVGFALWFVHVLATVASGYVATVPPVMPSGSSMSARPDFAGAETA